MSAFAGFVAHRSHVPGGIQECLANCVDGAGLSRARVVSVERGVFVFRQRFLSPEDHFESQPATGDGLVSMFDGRLDNRTELLGLLGLTSPAHAPLPDGELVRRAYAQWREAAPERLRGDFAWAVWDEASRRLMLSRDHSMQRTLYYCRAQGGVAFATGYRPLLALPGVSAEPDDLAVADLLLIAPDDTERSMYKDICWVGSSMRVLITPDHVQTQRLWEPQAGPVPRLKDDREYTEAARERFDDAVACRRRVAGPLITTVSGGLDSSAVAATAARQAAPDIVHAICLVPSGEGPTDVRGATNYADERPYVDLLARRYSNLRVQYLTPTMPESLELDPTSFFEQFCAPIWTPNNGSWFLTACRTAATMGGTTLLLGIMGNLTYSADGAGLLASLLRQRAWRRAAGEGWDLVRRWPRAARSSLPHELMSLLPRRFVPLLRRRLGRDTDLWQRLPFNPDFVREAQLTERLRQWGVAMDPWHPNTLMRGLQFGVMRCRMAAESRAMTRHLGGVTGSDPFADRRVIEFCLSLPADQFRRRQTDRRLARVAFADRVPPEITTKRLRGAQNVEWFRRLAPHRELFAADLDRMARSPLATRVLDLRKLRAALDSLPADEDEAYRSNWLRHHKFFPAVHLGRYLAWVDTKPRPSVSNGQAAGQE